MGNNFETRPDANLLTGSFAIASLDDTAFKTIVTREGDEHDLFEFWVDHEDKKVHCVAWDATANALKQAFENNKPQSISLIYKHKLNKFTQTTDFSVRRFTLD